MKSKRRAKLFLLIGAVVIVATLLFFFLAKPHLIMGNKSMETIFLLYSEVVFFAGMIVIDCLAEHSEQSILRTGGKVIILSYSILVFLVSLIFMNYDQPSVKGFLVMQVVVFVAALAFELMFVHAAKVVAETNDYRIDTQNTVAGMLDRLNKLNEDMEDQEEIIKMIQDLSFSDISEIVDADEEVNEGISHMEVALFHESLHEMQTAIEETEKAINKRKLQVRNAKAKRD